MNKYFLRFSFVKLFFLAHVLYKGNLIPGTYVPGWPTYDYLGIYPYRETLGFQVFMLIVVIVLSVASVLHRRRRARAAESDADAAAADEPSESDADAAPSESDAEPTHI